MKPSFVFILLIFMLFCDIFLHAAGNSKKQLVIENKTDKVTHAEVKNDMQFVPNVILL